MPEFLSVWSVRLST